MIAWLAGKAIDVLGGRILGGLIEGYKARLAAGNTQERIAADLAGKELELQQREMELQAQLRIEQTGRWYTPENLFCYIMVIYFGKIVVWDKVLGALTAGHTDPLAGDVATWAGMIMLVLFGKRGFENIARIIKR
jgi:hypothetical protein